MQFSNKSVNIALEWINSPVNNSCLPSHSAKWEPTRYGFQSYSWPAEQKKSNFPCPPLHLKMLSCELGSVVPSRVSLLICSQADVVLIFSILSSYEIKHNSSSFYKIQEKKKAGKHGIYSSGPPERPIIGRGKMCFREKGV